MNRDSINLQDPMSRQAFGMHEFFYRNLQIQEVLTTIRYGIEARKGLILLSGEAGSGKTTVLRKVSTGIADNVTCIIESDPRVSFGEILCRMLKALGCEGSDQDEPALIHACQSELRARLERCQIVALLLDNAHHLPDQTLRHITQNFLRNIEGLEGSLLQIVLAGRSGLKSKISQAALIPLRHRRPIVCELRALSNQEVGSYIKYGLKLNNHSCETFDERTIKRIALYARGNPRSIKSLCDRALQLAGASGIVTPELIEGVARDLDLHASEAQNELSLRREFEKPRVEEPSRTFEMGPVGSNFENTPTFPVRFDTEAKADVWGTARNSRPTWVAVLAIMVVLVGAAAIIPADSAVKLAADWSSIINRLTAPLLSSPPEPRQATPATPTEKVAKTEPAIRVPGPDYPGMPHDNNAQSTTIPPVLSKDDSTEHTPVAADNPSPRKRPDDAPAQTSVERRRPATEDFTPHRNLQSQVAKAIESRAIMGVEVSVVRGTAYLDGHVATERQRRAAERAARSVAGVERVQNRITLG